MNNISKKKQLKGVVLSSKMNSAVVVEVTRKSPHSKYGKVVSTKKKFYAKSDTKIEEGSSVLIEETRPVSKLIRWRVIDIIKKQ